MVAMQWQGGVLSLWTREPIPRKRNGSPATPGRRRPRPWRPPPSRRKRWRPLPPPTAMPRRPSPPRTNWGPTPSRPPWTRPRAASGQPPRVPGCGRRPGLRGDAPRGLHQNADKLTAILATAVTFDRQQVVADRNLCRNGTDLMGEGTRVLIRTDRGGFHSASPTGALGIARRGWKRELLEQITLCEGRPSLTAGTLLAHELAREDIPCTVIPDHAAATFLAQQGPTWCWPTASWPPKTGI